MFTTSADFKTGMAEPSRQLTARGLITYTDGTQALTSAEISKIQITENAGEHLPLGGVSASTLTLSLDNRSGEWNPGGSILGSHSLDGATVKLEVGVYYDSAYQYSNLGIFVLEDVVGQEQETLITLKGADYLANAAGITWADGLTYPKTVIQILTEACSQSGITLKSTTFPNSTQSIATKPVWDENTTCRDVIGYIACLGCGFARINRDGELEIIGFERNAAGDIDDLLNSYFTYTDGILTFNSDDTVLTLAADGADLTADPDGLVAGVGNDLVVTAFWDGDRYYVYPSRYKTLTRQGAIFGPFNALSVYEFGAPNGYGATRIADDINIVDNELNSVAVQGNPLLAYELCDTLMANMLTALSGLTFYGGSIAWQGDPTITCGDFVDVYSLNNEAIPLLVLNQTITLDAGFSMSSGNNLNSKVKGKAKTEYMRVFTPTGKLNAAALDGDINIRAGRQLNLLAGADIKVKSGANVDIEAGGKINLSAVGDIVAGEETLAEYLSGEYGARTTIWYQTSIPTSTAAGDLWYDIDATPIKIYRASISGADQIAAGEWVDVTTVALAQALSAAGTAQATADGKIVTFAQNDAPTATAVGDLWIDTNDNNKLYRWSGTAWTAYQDGNISNLLTAVGAKTTIFYQTSQPTATATGDIWYDTDAVPVVIYRWDGTAWGDITTTALSQALTAAGDAQATADGKIKTFAQNDPPNATAVGDLWVDTNDNNKLYRATAAGNNWALYKIAAGYVATSYITIANDIDIASGGNLNLLSGGLFTIASGNFGVDASGNVSMKGSVTANTGYIGGSSGFTIASQKLYSGKTTLTGTGAGVYLGTDGISLGSAGVAPQFKVTAAGALNATNATIKGAITADTGYIGGTGGFTIASAKLYSGKTTLNGTGAGVYIGTDGISLGAAGTPTFKVTAAGALNSTSGVIGGFTIGATTLSSTDVTFDSSNNKLTLKNLSLQNDTAIPGWGSIRMSEGHGFAVSADEFYVYIDDDTSTDSRRLCLALDYDWFSVVPDAYFAADVSALTFTDRP